MTGIPIVLVAVLCAPDLMHCEDVERHEFVFADMPACIAARNDWLAAMQGRRGTESRVAMARCRYHPSYARTGDRPGLAPPPAVN